MKTNQISRLLGINVSNQNKKAAIELSNHVLFKVIQLFKVQGFGLLTFYGVNTKNIKQHQNVLQNTENYLNNKGLNYIKISVQWNIKFRDVLNFREVGYFILSPTFDDMIEITKKFDQSLFIYSQSDDAQVYYANGTKFNLEKDSYNFGNIASDAVILNFVDFKLFIDAILDYNFQFLNRDDLKINDKVVVFSKSKFTFETCLEVIDVYDIRQNGILSFERSKISPAISPKVFHFDEIIWIFRLCPTKVISNINYYRNVV